LAYVRICSYRLKISVLAAGPGFFPAVVQASDFRKTFTAIPIRGFAEDSIREYKNSTVPTLEYFATGCPNIGFTPAISFVMDTDFMVVPSFIVDPSFMVEASSGVEKGSAAVTMIGQGTGSSVVSEAIRATAVFAVVSHVAGVSPLFGSKPVVPSSLAVLIRQK
jgi:hypothetical protein